VKWLVAAGLCVLLMAEGTLASDYVCRHVSVTDKETGHPLVGIEDLVYHPPSGTLILSVHDRWGDQDGNPDALMGLFSVEANDLIDVESTSARSLAGPAGKTMRPHGLAIRNWATEGWRLLVIDHRYLQEDERDGAPGTLIRDFSIAADGRLVEKRQLGHPELCPANDLDWLDRDSVLVSLDRTNCGGIWRFLELSRGQWRGKLARVDLDGNGAPQVLLDELGFPNGVLAMDNRVLVAFSREERLASFVLAGDRLEQLSSIALQGGGDNLAVDSEGQVLMAVHPDLTDFGLYSLRVWGHDSAPTRMVRISSKLSPAQVLFESDDGTPLSGITGFVEVGNRLIGGAAFDEGLAVCEAK
jgi:hypothetical protein